MKFFSEVNLPKSPFKLDYSSQILLLGSCFATHIHDQLSYYQFQANANPFGVLFHPKAILKTIKLALGHQKDFELVEHNGLCHSFLAHSSLSASTRQAVEQNLKTSVQVLSHALKQSTTIFISLGTAWYYSKLSNSAFVANCHKIPSKEFAKHLSSVGELKQDLTEIVRLVNKVNPECKLVFTVSPVKHLKDGLVENSRSKAHLLTTVHEVIAEAGRDCMYFPSYELVVDELRDYRFYTPDLAHPSPTAIRFIWQKLTSVYMNQSTLAVLKEVEAVQTGLRHKAFNPSSLAHQNFLANLETQQNELLSRFPHMNFNQQVDD